MISYMQNSLEFQGRQSKLATKALPSGLLSFLLGLLFFLCLRGELDFLALPTPNLSLSPS